MEASPLSRLMHRGIIIFVSGELLYVYRRDIYQCTKSLHLGIRGVDCLLKNANHSKVWDAKPLGLSTSHGIRDACQVAEKDVDFKNSGNPIFGGKKGYTTHHIGDLMG